MAFFDMIKKTICISIKKGSIKSGKQCSAKCISGCRQGQKSYREFFFCFFTDKLGGIKGITGSFFEYCI